MKDGIMGIMPFLDEETAMLFSGLNKDELESINEIRLRTGKPLCAVVKGVCKYVGKSPRLYDNPLFGALCTETQLQQTFMGVCRHSVYAYEDQINEGYITLPGGHRAGICGRTVKSDGIYRLGEVYGICIRIAGEKRNCGEKIARHLIKNGSLLSGIIISPPGGGKTTMLRDTARILSDSGRRVCIVDERGEIAALHNGMPQLDIGINTDIIDNMEKSKAIMIACRSLCPEIIIFDEIGSVEEARAVTAALNCGVAVLTSVHGNDFESALLRPQLSMLVAAQTIDKAFVLSGAASPGTIRMIIDIKDGIYENAYMPYNADMLYGGGVS